MAFLLFTPSSVNLWSTVAGPPVNGSQQQWSTTVNATDHRSTAAVNDGQRWRTIGPPPLDHRWTTARPPINHRSTVVDRQSRRVNSWAGQYQVDSLSFDDLYNNLRVIKNDVKGSTASSSSTQNVAFVSENTSSTNDVSTAYGVSNPSGQNSQYEHASSYSLLVNQSSCSQLDHEDLEQLDEFHLEEIDLKWQVAMISIRMKKFYKKTGRNLQFDAKEPVGFDKTKVECYNCHKTGHFARECRTKGNQDSKRVDAWNSGNKDGRRSGKQEDSKALVTIDGEGVDWTSHLEEEEDFALMACNSSDSDTEVQSCSNECVASYNKLKKLCDEQRAQFSDVNIEIKAYTQALKKVEAQLVAHQQGL
ncbi:putative ribonuclease H-like domain-containing protein [Tanacetum coccineum]|uniref:Ribonuclease H-like domain-containing protein n=1 Tax=Tanacetum coccineum TaxID=301880 RepID=A0ABQ5DKL9_9ASTR